METSFRNDTPEWLGQVPRTWSIAPAWTLFGERNELADSDATHLTPSRHFGVISQIEYAKLTGHRPNQNPLTADNMKAVCPGDFVISMGSHESGIEYSRVPGKVSNDYRVLVPSELVHKEYFKWFLKSKPFIAGLLGLTTEIRKGQRIHYSRFALLQLPLPPLDTQRAIADYLDRETSEIDAMLDKLDGLGRLLEERRTNACAETVKNLAPSAPWVQCKLLCHINTGSGDTQDSNENGTYPFYVRSQTPQRYDDWEFDGEAVLTAGDGAGVGKVFHLVNEKFMAHQRVYVLNEFRGVTAPYFYHVFKWLFPNAAKDGSAKNTVDSVRQPMIANLKVPLPPLDEQERIVAHLDETTARIDAMLAKTQQLKDLLTERRSALITAAVTGQIEVH